jgi:hypothetical protein
MEPQNRRLHSWSAFARLIALGRPDRDKNVTNSARICVHLRGRAVQPTLQTPIFEVLNPLVVGSIPTRPTNDFKGLARDRRALCLFGGWRRLGIGRRTVARNLRPRLLVQFRNIAAHALYDPARRSRRIRSNFTAVSAHELGSVRIHSCDHVAVQIH